MKLNADPASHVVVTGARRAQAAWSVWHKPVASASGQDTQSFEHAGYIRSFKAVVAMLSLDVNLDQSSRLKALQMDARSRWADSGYHSKFGAGSRIAIHKAIEYARPRRLADGGCDSWNCGIVAVTGYNHTSTLNEVCLPVNWHSDRWYIGTDTGCG
jgi:hypothetical protein